MKNLTAKERKALVDELIAQNRVVYEIEGQGVPRGISLRGWDAIKNNEGVLLIQHPHDKPLKKTRGRGVKVSPKTSTGEPQKKKAVDHAENKKSED